MEQNYFSTEYWAVFLNETVDWFIHFLPKMLVLLILFFIIMKAYRFAVRKIRVFMISRADKSKDSIESEKRINTLIGIISKTGAVTLWVIFVMMLLNCAGIEIAPILAGAGIVGFAVGFGAQTLVKDIITGFFILLEDQIRVGDIAIINGVTGTVEEMQLRTIILRDASGVVHIFETGQITTMANITKEWSALLIDIGVAYKEDYDRVTAVMEEVGKNLYNDEKYKDRFIEPIEIFGLDRFDNSAVIVRVRIKTLPHEQWAVGREYRRRIKYAFDENGIEIPFPHTSLYWGEDSKPIKMEMIK
jgi:small conductance mechanosensitive channel